VDSAINYNGWFNRRTIGEQRSEMMTLSADQNYLLIGHVKEGTVHDHYRVSCHGNMESWHIATQVLFVYCHCLVVCVSGSPLLGLWSFTHYGHRGWGGNLGICPGTYL